MSLERTKALIQQHHIRVRNEWIRSVGNGGTLWKSTLHMQRRQFTMSPFHLGPHYTGEPLPEYVLETALSDAASVENNECWTPEVTHQTERLKRFLAEEYETFLWES